jgi:hypothetical protein
MKEIIEQALKQHFNIPESQELASVKEQISQIKGLDELIKQLAENHPNKVYLLSLDGILLSIEGKSDHSALEKQFIEAYDYIQAELQGYNRMSI